MDKNEILTRNYSSMLGTLYEEKIFIENMWTVNWGYFVFEEQYLCTQNFMLLSKQFLIWYSNYSNSLYIPHTWLRLSSMSFLNWKKNLKDCKFSIKEEVIKAVETWFGKTFFLKGLEALQVLCNEYIQLRGDYVE